MTSFKYSIKNIAYGASTRKRHVVPHVYMAKNLNLVPPSPPKQMSKCDHFNTTCSITNPKGTIPHKL